VGAAAPGELPAELEWKDKFQFSTAYFQLLKIKTSGVSDIT